MMETTTTDEIGFLLPFLELIITISTDKMKSVTIVDLIFSLSQEIESLQS
jgi:hypothetical protein